ncbi:MAG TPA: hypothetical protein V6C65_41215 [Allocoleopsis sp.]
MTQDHSKTPESNPPSAASPETPPVDAASDTTGMDAASAAEGEVMDALLEAGTLEAAESELVESELVESELVESELVESELAESELVESELVEELATGTTPSSGSSAPSNTPPPAKTTAQPTAQPMAQPMAQSSASEAASPTAQVAERPTGKLQAFLRLTGQLWGIVVALTPLVVNVLRSLWEISLKVLDWLWNSWKALLPKIKPLLPASLNRSPDWILTTIAFSLVIFILWLITTLLPGKAPSIATEPVPPKLVAPAPVVDPDKIARLQSQVTEVADQYAEGLIQAVQANFVQGRLLVQVTDNWYDIAAADQDKVANEILKRSRRLDFTQLELLDSEGKLVARSPVVGSGIVVYERIRQAG